MTDSVFDIVTRLLGMAAHGRPHDSITLTEAADEIRRLRAALRKIAHSADHDTIISPDGDRHQQAVEIALETLEGDGR